MIRRPPRSTQSRSSAASDVYKRQLLVMENAWSRTSRSQRNFTGLLLSTWRFSHQVVAVISVVNCGVSTIFAGQSDDVCPIVVPARPQELVGIIDGLGMEGEMSTTAPQSCPLVRAKWSTESGFQKRAGCLVGKVSRLNGWRKRVWRPDRRSRGVPA